MKLGSNDISAVKIGSTDVSKVYIGSTEVWSSFTGLLDTYTGAAAAYSLRLLRGSYSGSAIRVRRASDNTEQDIGFVNNELDTSSLTTFCSGTNGFVKTWYDQSGNARDASQTTASNQPQIVSSGSVILENGKPALDLDGVDDGFSLNSSISYSNTYTFNVYNPKSDTAYGIFTNLSAVAPIAESGSSAGWTFGYTINDSYINNVRYGDNETRNGFYLATTNQQNLVTYDLDSTSNSITNIYNRSGFLLDGFLQELIFYPSDQSSNRSGIETNINDFYDIY